MKNSKPVMAKRAISILQNRKIKKIKNPKTEYSFHTFTQTKKAKNKLN